MKTLNTLPPAGEASVSRFEAIKPLAFLLAESDPELLEPELIAWNDRSRALASPAGIKDCVSLDDWTSKPS